MVRRSGGEAVVELFLYALPVYLPFYQALLVHGLGRAILILALAMLLMFLATNRHEVIRALIGWLAAFFNVAHSSLTTEGFRSSVARFDAAGREPLLASQFQRPPPRFA